MSKKILVVDDDETLNKMLTNYFTSHGYEIFTAIDGDQGLNLVKEKKPDLIILDVQMPKMNGYTFVFECRKIQNPFNTPIIVLTAKQGMAEIFKVEGVREYMTKPFSMESLLTNVKKHLS